MIRALLAHEGFRDGLTHGLSIVLGLYAGLLLWALFLAPAVSPLPAASFAPVTVPWPQAGAPAPAPSIPEKPPAAPIAKPPQRDGDLPLEGLSEEIPPFGTIPMIRTSDNKRPFDAYRRPFATQDLKSPLISLVVLDYGLSAAVSGPLAGGLPPDVSLVLSSGATDGAAWSKKARAAGNELWLELAVQPFDYPESDAGRHALLTASSIEKNSSALLTQMGRGLGYAGLLAPVDGPSFHSGADADFLAGLIFPRGLGLVLNASGADGVLRDAANKIDAPFYARPLSILDKTDDPAAMAAAFEALFESAQARGYAIGMIRPGKLSLAALNAFAKSLPGRGVVLAPLSVVAERGKALSP